MDAEIAGTSSGNVNSRLVSLTSVTSASSSSISAFSSSSYASSTTETERPRIFRNKHHHDRHWGPFFEEPLNSTTSGDNSVTTAHLYTEAVLNCRVGMLKDKTVCCSEHYLCIQRLYVSFPFLLCHYTFRLYPFMYPSKHQRMLTK